MSPSSNERRVLIARSTTTLLLACALAACGGGGDGGGGGTQPGGNTGNGGGNPAPPFSTTAQVAAGSSHSLLLKTDGSVVAWGDQELGQLGNGVENAVTQRVPQAVLNLASVKQISAGAFHNLALRNDGTVFSWGANGSGRLGLGRDGGVSPAPTAIAGLNNIIAVAAGRSHSLALRSDGVVFAWGDNSFGQLGLGHFNLQLQPLAITGLSNVTAIAAGHNHSLVRRADGSVLAFGNNADGQLGLGDTTTRNAPAVVSALAGRGVTQLAGGRFHSLARLADGSVLAWGSSTRGQVGRAAATADGFGTFTLPVAATGVSGATSVAAGEEFSVVRLSDGTLRTFGHNGSGRLGNGTSGVTTSTFVAQVPQVSTVSAIAAGVSHGLALLQDGRVGCWGSNFFSQCGRIEITDLTVPVEVGPGLRANP